MKFLVFVGILLPVIYGEVLTYPDDITAFTGTWSNPDNDANYPVTTITGFDAVEGTKLSDGDVTSGFEIENPAGKVWGKTGGNTKGLVGDFAATLKAPTNYAFWNINKMSLTFSVNCFGDVTPTVNAYYTDIAGTKVILDGVTSTTENYVVTFEVDTSSIDVNTLGPIGFDVTSNQYCEGGYEIREMAFEGVAVATSDPTLAPTMKPSVDPTTSTPTMAPTGQCKGEITQGDPHFGLMGMAVGQQMFNYQGLKWHYYLFPCSKDNYEHWPFFILSYHKQCFWKGNPKGCINDNRLILNTKPEPWIIDFTGRSLEITVGTDVNNQQVSDFNLKKKYNKKNPLIIKYNDGAVIPQYGELHIYYSGGTIILQLYNVGYYGYPRTCERGQKSGTDCGKYECEDQVIDIRNSGSWTVFTCPSCLRNIACGLMGKYERGDCTRKQMSDPTNKCYNLFVGSDKVFDADPNGPNPVLPYTPPKGVRTSDSVFIQFAETWKKATVDAKIVNAGYTVSELRNRNFKETHNDNFAPLHHSNHGLEGRALDVADPDFYDGLCKGDMDKIREINETCRTNTMVKYSECCAQIGICPALWKGCIEDLCSCTAPNANNTWTDQQCLEVIVHDSMNTTCSYELLYPTATPTGAPTKHPTSIVAGLPTGAKAKDLIWLYLIFVVVFVIIAGAAYWYYRKKNVGKVSMDDDEEMGIEAPPVQTHGVHETFSQD